MSTGNTLPTDMHGKVTMLQNILVARATGNSGDIDAFSSLRSQLMNDENLRDKLPDRVRTCRDLDQFWGYIKHRASTYADRRRIIWNEFSPLLDFLEAPEPFQGVKMGNETKTAKAHCPECGPDRKSLVRGEYRRDTSQNYENGQFSVEFSHTYRIVNGTLNLTRV